MKLYDYLPSGNGYKIRLLLAQLGLPYSLVEKDIMRGETRTPEFLAMNANGRIPLLELDDGRWLAESNAILFYLAEGTPLLPSDRYARGEALQWMFFEQYSHAPHVAGARFWIRFLGKREEWAHKVKGAHERGYQALDVMEKHLGSHDFFAGDAYSIADIALYAYTHVAAEGEFDLTRFERVSAWLARVASQPRHVPITHRG
jgi:glutathione S-transferase